jgi:predicted GNAT family N-acyltransferase
MEVHIVPVSWSSHRDQLRQVRETVFIDEQQVPRDIEWDGEDDVSTHFLAITEGGQAVGCARLLPSGQIGRMAVLPAYRGTGLGRRLLETVIEEAKRQGFSRVHLHAQSHASEFYRKGGFLPVGGEFMEAGIPHQAMALELPLPFQPPGEVERPVVRDSPDDLGDEPTSHIEQYHGETDCLLGLLRCLEVPRRRLVIFSQHLDHALYDQEQLVEAMSRFARSSPSVEARVLVSDSSLIVSRGHRLVELARRLDSRIEVRRISRDLSPGEQSFVVWDHRGYFLMPDFRDYTALVNLYDPVQAKRLLEAFDYFWARSTSDPELRTLKL